MTEALRKYLDEQAEELQADIQSALEACDNDPMRALTAAIIANTFLMDENERLKAQISTGFARQTVRKAAKKNPPS